MTTLQEKLKKLAKMRIIMNDSKESQKHWQQEVEKTNEFFMLKETNEFIKNTGSEIDILEKEIKEESVLIFDGVNRNPFPGIQIKEFHPVSILNMVQAFQWASQNAPSTLKLDETKFKKAVENLELTFIEKKTEYRGQIDSDLSALLIEVVE